MRVWTAGSGEIEALRPRLGEILVDCVHHGASVGFLDPLDLADADVYWQRVERAVGDARCVLLLAALADGDVAGTAELDDTAQPDGTVQLDLDTLPNQRHRATVSKLLVHTSARRRGLGEALMAELERVALEHGRRLLTLDTATGSAARLYERRGWTAAGTIPGYALDPDGSLTSTTFYWKELNAPARG